jgi:hypothetical protein
MIDYLLSKKIIDKEQYLMYKVFKSDDGADYLQSALNKIVLEEPASLDHGALSWRDGRHSIFRDIINTINKIEGVLKDESK